MLNVSERQRVNSYLAIKFGITLDQFGATSYIASNGTGTAWDVFANGFYNKNITVIGRDDGSDLLQKQSRGNGTGAMVTIGIGTGIAVNNSGNNGTFANNLTFAAISDNNGDIADWTGG